MARSSVAKTTVETTSWGGSYDDVGGANPAAGDLDPNELGFDEGIPDEVRSQFEAAKAAARLLIESRSLGDTATCDIELSGEASVGHEEGDTITVTVRRTDNALTVLPDPVEGETVYVATRYTDDVGAPIGEPEPELP